MDKLSSASGQKLPSSSHRLPTVSASEALRALQTRGPRTISTGLSQLDRLLAGAQLRSEDTNSKDNGLERGKITEVWGPSGAGKTAFAMQVAAGVLTTGSSAIWVDTTNAVVKSRLRCFLPAVSTPSDGEDQMKNLHSYFVPTVAHLLALTIHAPANFIPSNTSLMVIDGLHTIFDVAYPRHRSNAYPSKNEAMKWASGRRYGVLGSLMGALKKLAAQHSIAILITTGCATRVRTGSGLGAVLVSGLGGAEWETGISNRVVIFRDLATTKEDLSQRLNGDGMKSARFIGVQKVNGRSFGEEGEIGQIMSFTVEKDGLKEMKDCQPITDTAALALTTSSPLKGRKRGHDEIADSDEDAGSEYEWLEEDVDGLIDAAALNEGSSHAATEVLPVG